MRTEQNLKTGGEESNYFSRGTDDRITAILI